jgi:hypothetical protein
MFAAIDEALARLYPTRRWAERDDASALDAGEAAELAAELGERAARRLEAQALVRPGADDEWCEYVYLLCFGRRPTILELREGAASVADVWDEAAAEQGGLEERHLRVALSTLGRFAAVQEVALRLERSGDLLVVTESPRTGVFDPVLLPRMRKLLAVLAELDVRHFDFGDLTTPPDGYDGSAYRERYACDATVANYLFYPQPASSITTALIPLS